MSDVSFRAPPMMHPVNTVQGNLKLSPGGRLMAPPMEKLNSNSEHPTTFKSCSKFVFDDSSD